MNTHDSVVASPIATPSNFPLTWENPEDANLYWQFDRMHWPTPVTPLTGQYIDTFVLCANPMLAAFEFPARMHSRRLNTYHYHATAPLPLAEQEMAEQLRRGEAKMGEALRHLDESWRTDYLPLIKESLADWARFDLETASMPALLGHLDETLKRVMRLAEIHHNVQLLAALGPSLFQDLYSELFGDDVSPDAQAFAAYRLLQGFDNQTFAANRALWRLSRRALATSAVVRVLQGRPAAQVVPALGTFAEGRTFLGELQTYLEAYGQRSAKVLELDAPTWLDDPTPLICILQEYMRQPDRDVDGELAAQVAERERLVAETRQCLHGYPQPVIDQFESLLKAAQAGMFLSEEHNYWIDQWMTYSVRRVMWEFGCRFAAAGVLDRVDDVFYLLFEEVREMAVELPRLDRRSLVAGRRAEMAYFCTIEPPPALGMVPAGPPPDDPLSRADRRFWGVPPPADKPTVLYGNAASPGLVRGRAKVLRSLAEAGKLQKGDVLVTQTTQPAWTPLFAIAAAVVTDTGGILSHGAVVAREYGLPAVVGVAVATRTLRDGQLVEVDGTAGLVRIMP